MAEFSLTIGRWRMIRLALRKKRFRFEDLRSMAARDKFDMEWLTENGFFVDLGGGVFELSPRGAASADMGFYQWTPTPKPAPAAAPKRPRKK